jgi:hypothetical protein
LAASVLIMRVLVLRHLRAHARLPGSVSTCSFQRVGLTANAVPVVALTHPSAVRLHGTAARKGRPTHPSLGPARRCRGVPFRPASSIGPRCYASTYPRLFALLMLAGDLAPVMPEDEWELWSAFARFSSVAARSSHLSANASRRVFLAVELAWDASLTASLAYFRYSSCFIIEAFPCGSPVTR